MTYEELVAEQEIEFMGKVILPAAERRQRIERELALMAAESSQQKWPLLRRVAAASGGLMVDFGERVGRWGFSTLGPPL